MDRDLLCVRLLGGLELRRGDDALPPLPSASGIYARNPLERHLRDAMTVRHHGFLSESRLETAGQVYLGVEPEFAFVGL